MFLCFKCKPKGSRATAVAGGGANHGHARAFEAASDGCKWPPETRWSPSPHPHRITSQDRLHYLLSCRPLLDCRIDMRRKLQLRTAADRHTGRDQQQFPGQQVQPRPAHDAGHRPFKRHVHEVGPSCNSSRPGAANISSQRSEVSIDNTLTYSGKY